jgi:FkbM family methyltransferase
MFNKRKNPPVEWGFLNEISVDIDFIIDVGANDGSYPNRIRSYLGKKNLPSILFEPQQKVIKSENITPKQCTEVVNQAVGATCEKVVTLHVAANEGNSSSLFQMASLHSKNAPNANFTGEDIQIGQVALDCALKNYDFNSALLKIDTQGNELEVLNGSVKTLKNVKAISIEVSFQSLYLNAPLANRIFDFLYQIGFVLYGMDPMFKDLKNGAWLHADAYFIRQ